MPAKGDGVDTLTIADREFRSRLMVGTGKYASAETMRDAVLASGAEIVTVAVRRMDLGGGSQEVTAFLPDDVLLLPNTAGCESADEAVRVARLARAGGLPSWVKLEVIPDPRHLLPDPVETLRAAEVLVGEGFTVLPYVLPDPVLARKLADVGCATVMPLAAPIGTGRGLKLREAIRITVEEVDVPVVVDAGLGAPSHAAEAMELGADAVLVNTALARAGDPVRMARAFRLAVEAGREAHRAGVMDERPAAEPSSPAAGLVTHA
ncbi:MAG: thiazole synthase [Thermoleophilia bacterium]|nr:thiazole synthase [Thermoleophilia bacterium]